MTVTPRTHLDFRLTEDIPRHWFGGDAFLSRYFDAHSLLTPAGERFFIESVREYRGAIDDPQLAADAQGFIQQEAQHSLQHRQSNQRLEAQGIAANEIDKALQASMSAQRRRMPKRLAIAISAASEHLTALGSQPVVEQGRRFANADLRIYALYAWHCTEEIEHRAVCFDVMQQAAGVGYFTRTLAMLLATASLQLQLFGLVGRLLRADGFGWRQRTGLIWRGLGALYGREGLMRGQIRPWLDYFRPGFHPRQHFEGAGYQLWMTEFESSGDPMAAAAALRSR